MAIVLAVHAGSAYLVYAIIPNCDDRASFGDMFGAVNALFAALAFAGVVYAILLQRKELNLQRREIQLTRLQIAEQTRIHEQRLDMTLAAQRPLLRFVRLVSRGGEGPTSGDMPNLEVLTFELHNDGGPMYHALGRIFYRTGPIAELFPCDQDEDATLTPTADVTDASHDLPRAATCHLHLHCRLHAGQALATTEITFAASLIIRYIDWINTPRVAEYQLLVRQEQGRVFLIQDVDPVTAIKRGLLNEVPGHAFRLPDGKEAPELEDLFPDHFQ